MPRKKNLQIGTSNFRHLIDENGYFVDKTLLIKEIIDSGYHVMIMPRPRRFGKSLNLSMLRYYFDNQEKDTQALFEPFKIWQQGERYTQQQGNRPVIHFSLKSGKATSFEESKKAIYFTITTIYQQFAWLLDTEILIESEKTSFHQILNNQATNTEYEAAILKLSELLYRHSGEKTLILLDEYDAAIHAGFYHGFYDEIIALMKSLLGNTFKDNDALYKGVITGILRVAKESIFSDMNNPGIFSILSYDFADKFGFTETEVKDLVQYFDLDGDFEKVKAWYDGYRIGEFTDIYNPWSIINYVARHREGFKSYWGNTSSDDIIKSSIVAKEADELRASMETLIKGESVVQFIDENIIFSEFDKNPDVFWSLITMTGYLTPVKAMDLGAYELKIPNYEIRLLFRKIILDWFAVGLKVHSTTLRKMVHALVERRMDDFLKYFRAVMGDTFSYYDTHTEPERVFQAYVLGLLGMLADDYIIKSNRESGKGRYDILLIPRDKSRFGILMEIKQIDKDASKKQIETALSKAMKQIKINDYHKELEMEGIEQRLEIAVVFVGKEAYLRDEFVTNE